MFEGRDFLMIESQHSNTLHNFVRYWGQSRPSVVTILRNGEETISSIPEYLSRVAVPSFNIFYVPHPWSCRLQHVV